MTRFAANHPLAAAALVMLAAAPLCFLALWQGHSFSLAFLFWMATLVLSFSAAFLAA